MPSQIEQMMLTSCQVCLVVKEYVQGIEEHENGKEQVAFESPVIEKEYQMQNPERSRQSGEEYLLN